MRFIFILFFIVFYFDSIKSELSDEIFDGVTTMISISDSRSNKLKPFYTIGADINPIQTTTPESSNEKVTKRSSTSRTPLPNMSVYSIINAKKQTKKTKAGKCSCFGETSTMIRYIKVLNDDLELGDIGNLSCSSPSDASYNCEKLCKEKASERFGEDIDLKRPYSLKDDKVSIGQELCRQVGSIILPSHLKIKSHIVCPGQKLATYRDTGLKSKQKFVCVLNRFRTIAG